MRIYWKIERISGYKKILQFVEYNGKKFEAVDYLTQNISSIIEQWDHIYVGFDSEKNNPWNTYWTWSHSEHNPFDDKCKDVVYAGIYDISKIRKQKLEKLNEI